MKGRFLVMCALLICNLTYGQVNSSINNNGNLGFDNCKETSFCIDCGDIKARFPGNEENLTDFFKDHIDKKMLKKFEYKGAIMLQIIVDSLGKPCLKSISNNSLNNPSNKIKDL